MENPIDIFTDWYQEELDRSKLRIPSACCLTTIGTDGYPNSRFVSLKDVQDGIFILTGSLNSRKGTEMKHNPKASLTFWWTESEKQIRIQGDVSIVSELDSKKYFSERHEHSKIVSTIFEQGKEIIDFSELRKRFENGKEQYTNKEISKPKEWAGFGITPKRIEFLEFLENRLHRRTLYTSKNKNWQKVYLQP